MKRRVRENAPSMRTAMTVKRLRARINKTRVEITRLLNELERALALLARHRRRHH